MLEELKKCVKSRLNNKIFDIVAYGSLVKGKYEPEDNDMAVIFKEGLLNERLEIIQQIKRRIKTDKKLDIKGFLLADLFKPEFFGRSGIFFEGISLIDGKPFSNKIGFNGVVIFFYNLRNKSHTEKVKFNYLLSGRNNTEGLIRLFEGKQLAPGVFQLPIKNSIKFEEILKKNNVVFEKKNILVER